MRRVVNFFLTVFLLVGVGVGSGLLVMKIALYQEEVTVPDLIGKDVVSALKILNKEGLNLKVMRQEYNPSVEKYLIISQDPVPQRSLKKNRDVKVVVSQGFQEGTVPEVRAEPFERAEALLTQVGLKVGEVVKIASPKYPKGTVIAQSPVPQTSIPLGSSVSLIISQRVRGEAYSMPDLIGQSLRDGVKTLDLLELKAEKILYADYPGLEAGVIIGQNPLPGYRVERGSQVQLSISKERLSEVSR
ncbi:MAG: PASTA domain-containing protein [Candidatus Tectomicrobia bacterium]|nr:PASTA domain-containing protein [Candidatus Tectomicrobia bacterium]